MTSLLATPLGRRAWLRATSTGLLSFSWGAGWVQGRPAVSRPVKRAIVLWMDGGPSHLDTFDPKPEAASRYRGELDAIATAVPGIFFSERFPKLARQMHRLAVIRGMSTEEADHGRARVYMHTGYKPGQGGVTYPVLGSIVSAELGQDEFPLPSFVVTGTPLGKYDFLTEPGFRGPRHTALAHADPSRPLEHLQPAVEADEFSRRLQALDQANAAFAQQYRAESAAGHRAVLERAVRLMRASASQAFDLAREPEAMRDRYGPHPFAQRCLWARRLIEVGVPFVEIYQGNWDTHEKRVVDQAKELMPVVDHGMAALLDDLSERGLLDDTLVVWMGEFGRTPQVNREGGRDHYAKAWCTMLAGGGIRAGQVVGRTDATGATVLDRPISARDFMATICKILGIDHAKEIQTPVGRPIRVVESGGQPIQELFG